MSDEYRLQPYTSDDFLNHNRKSAWSMCSGIPTSTVVSELTLTVPLNAGERKKERKKERTNEKKERAKRKKKKEKVRGSVHRSKKPCLHNKRQK
jgi:DNA invertase Pin-like site-specific DNA recombinase